MAIPVIASYRNHFDGIREMDWPVPEKRRSNAGTASRSVIASGKKIKLLRQDRDWSQEEFAHRADLSERFIRKAEASENVRFSSLQRIAETLSGNGKIVSVSDLIDSDPNTLLRLVDRFISGLDGPLDPSLGSADLKLVTKVSGNPTTIPFAGIYHGIIGFSDFERKLTQSFHTFEVQQKTIDRFIENERFCICVDVRMTTQAAKKTQALNSWIVFRSSGHDRLLIQTDTEAVAGLLTSTRA